MRRDGFVSPHKHMKRRWASVMTGCWLGMPQRARPLAAGAGQSATSMRDEGIIDGDHFEARCVSSCPPMALPGEYTTCRGQFRPASYLRMSRQSPPQGHWLPLLRERLTVIRETNSTLATANGEASGCNLDLRRRKHPQEVCRQLPARVPELQPNDLARSRIDFVQIGSVGIAPQATPRSGHHSQIGSADCGRSAPNRASALRTVRNPPPACPVRLRKPAKLDDLDALGPTYTPVSG